MKSRFQIPYPLLRLISMGLLKAGFSLKAQGAEALSGIQGSVILAGNHTGYLDSLILMAAVKRPFSFLMDEKVFGWGLIGKLVCHGNIIPINPAKPKHSLKTAIQALEVGTSICIFPEGKLSLSGAPGHFQDGVAFLQEKSGAVVLPFAISGGFEAWPHGKRWPRLHPIRIAFGEPILPGMAYNRGELTCRLRAQVLDLLEAQKERGSPCKTKNPLRVSS